MYSMIVFYVVLYKYSVLLLVYVYTFRFCIENITMNRCNQCIRVSHI